MNPVSFHGQIQPSKKESTLKVKNLLPQEQILILRVDPIDMRDNENERVTSPENVFHHLKIWKQI